MFRFKAIRSKALTCLLVIYSQIRPMILWSLMAGPPRLIVLRYPNLHLQHNYQMKSWLYHLPASLRDGQIRRSMPPLSLPQSFFYFLGILSMPMFQCISEMTERPIVGFTVATTRVQASGKYTNACVCFLHYFLTFKLFTEKAFPAVFHAYDDHEVTHCEIEIKAI